MKNLFFISLLVGCFSQLQASFDCPLFTGNDSLFLGGYKDSEQSCRENTAHIVDVLSSERILSPQEKDVASTLLQRATEESANGLIFDRNALVENQIPILLNFYNLLMNAEQKIYNDLEAKKREENPDLQIRILKKLSETAYCLRENLNIIEAHDNILFQITNMITEEFRDGNGTEKSKIIKYLKAFHYRNSLEDYFAFNGAGTSSGTGLNKTAPLDAANAWYYSIKDDVHNWALQHKFAKRLSRYYEIERAQED